MMDNSNQIKIGSIISGVVIGINILVSLIYTPIMIRFLGNSEYGLYNTVSSTISMLSILSLGFGGGYIRYFSIYRSRDDNDSINKLNGLYLIVFSIVGIVALICGIALTNNIELVFDNGLTSSEYILARKLMLLSTINLAISFPMSVFQIIINANEKFILLKAVSGIQLIIGPFITIPLLLHGYRSFSIIFVSFVLSLIVDFIFIYYVYNKLNFRFIFCGFDLNIVKDIVVFTSYITINIVVDQINLNIDKLLLARLKNTFAVALCSVAYVFYNHYQTFSTTISNLFIPTVHRIVNNKKDESGKINQSLTDVFIKVGRWQFIVLALILSCFLLFGKQFIYYWAGEEYIEAYYAAMLILVSSTIPLIQNVGIEIQRAKNIHKFRSVVYLIIAVANLIMSIILIPKYGVFGAAFGTATSFIVGNGLIMNIYYYQKCGIDILLFWKNIINISKSLIIPVLFGIVINILFNSLSLSLLILKIIIYSLVYLVFMYLFGINDFEKKAINNTIKRIS